MRVYLDLALLLNFGVDFLLLMGVNRMAGLPVDWKRGAAAAALGSVYSGVCLLPGFRFLAGLFWRILCLAFMTVIAFGWNRSALHRGSLFLLLSMALGGICVGLGRGTFSGLLLAAAGLLLLCIVGFRGRSQPQHLVEVELRYQSQTLHLTALQDTGNTLRDPVTGQQVLVAGADVAEKLAGLTREQLRRPVDTVASGRLQGLRLIPYHAVGQQGMLLALRCDEVRIGNQKGGGLVAFSPEPFPERGTYQALTGGMYG